MPPQKLKIGELSRQSGIAVGALRYYESLDLLVSERGQNGYRYYDPASVRQVHFIKKAQSLGFSLEDIREILNLHGQGNQPCHFVQTRLQQKIDQMEAQILEMTRFKAMLEDYRDRWNEVDLHPAPDDICPLIEAVPLDSHD